MFRQIIEHVDILALDIETVAGSPEEIELGFRTAWQPRHDWKDETIGRRWREAYEKYRQKAALLDSARILSVAFAWGPGEFEVWHTLPQPTRPVPARRYPTEKALLSAVAEAMEQLDSDCVLTGHNIVSFDLPRLRLGMLRHGITLPPPLARKDQTVFDTMREWVRFSVEERPYVALSDILEVLGMPNHKSHVDGEDIAVWMEQHRFEEVVMYAAADVVAEYDLALRMMGARCVRAPQNDGLLLHAIMGPSKE